MKHFLSGLVLMFICITAFGQNVNKEAYKRYVNIEKYNQPMEGFIILNNGKKETVKIKYEEPYLLFDDQLPLVTYHKKNKEKLFLKSKLAGFFVNNRLYVREIFEGDSSRWVMVVREGAIRESIVLKPNIPFERPEYYSVNRLITNTITLKAYFVGRLAINFGLNMSSMIFDYSELNRKVRDAEEGYKFLNYQQIIARYNMWFNSKNPDVIYYLLPRPDYQKFIDN
ncbi:hypothetical protein MNBD_BACTEROID06-62 [hydrothermal vent metagenome]|uniref:Uncharacterized protein n=1 Tax=hydrothermal vent metagenome TaxID=652676 RepID=A0A3B0V7S5_9ZZZZ